MAAKVTGSKPAAKRPPRRPAPPPRPAFPPGGEEVEGLDYVDGVPVLRVSGDDDSVVEDRVPLFYIDDREFTVLANPSASIGLEMLHIVAQGGGSEAAQAMASDYLLTEMLGEEGYAAFRRSRRLTTVQRQWVVEKCRDLAMGADEDPKP